MKTRTTHRYCVDRYGVIFREWNESEYKNNDPNKPIHNTVWEFYCPVCNCGCTCASKREAEKHKLLHNRIGHPFGTVSYGDVEMTCLETGMRKVGTENIKTAYYKFYKE